MIGGDYAMPVDAGDSRAYKPGSCPVAVEGYGRSDAVVDGRAEEDHAAIGEELTPYELSGEQCVELAELLTTTALFLGDAYGGYAARLRAWADVLTLTEVIE